MDTSQGGSSSYNAGGGGGGGGSGRRGDEQTNGHIAEEQNERGPRLTGYVRSVRDDLTAFVSSAGEKAAAAGPSCLSASGEGASRSGEVFQGTAAEEGQSARELGAIGRTLSVLARLGEDLGRMVRLRGRVEHQVRGWKDFNDFALGAFFARVVLFLTHEEIKTVEDGKIRLCFCRTRGVFCLFVREQ